MCTIAISVPSSWGASGHEEIFIRKGVELRKKGKNAEALAEFEKAFEEAHTPRAAAQLGLCEQALERWLSAYVHLSVALAAESDSWVSQNRNTLNKSLSDVASHLGRIEVKGTPVSAMVNVGGDVIGPLGDAPVAHVAPGTVQIMATANGYVAFKETRTIAAGETIVLGVKLSPIPSAPAVIAAPATTPPPAFNEAPQLVRENERSNIGPWIGWGTGAAFLGAGVFFGIKAASKAEDARTAPTYSKSSEDAASSARTLEWVCVGAGVGAIAAGTFLYFKTPGNTEVAIAPSLLAGGTTLNWQGKW
jgi:hypothetical protein